MRVSVAAVLLAMVLSGCGGGGGDPVNVTKTVTVRMQLAGLPTDIAYNHPVHASGMEYMWAATFDIDNSGAPSIGDLKLTLQQYKSPDAVATVGPLSDIHAYLWVYVSDTSWQTVAPIHSTISGNTITLSVDKSVYADLGAISELTGVNFETEYYEPATLTRHRDDYPTSLHGGPALSSRFIIPANNRMTDTSGDVLAPIVDLETLVVEITE